jgi:hypothetical protein
MFCSTKERRGVHFREGENTGRNKTRVRYSMIDSIWKFLDALHTHVEESLKVLVPLSVTAENHSLY